MNNSKISVIVPIYNREKYIDKCISSIVNQTYTDLEILLVDDGSADASLEKCGRWAEKDSRIVVIAKENGGVSSARNAGIEAASGAYIGFVDSDDYIEPETYERLVRPFEIYDDIQMTSCGSAIGENERKIDKDAVFTREDAYIMMFNYVTHFKAYNVNKLYLTDIIKNNGIRFCEDIAFGEDARFNFDYFGYINNFCAVAYCGYHYVINESSATYKDENSTRWKTADLPQYFIDNSPSERVSKYIQRWNIVYYRSIAYEYYIGIADKKTYNYIKSRIRQDKKAYMKNEILTKKEKLFILCICDVDFLYRNYKILRRKLKDRKI